MADPTKHVYTDMLTCKVTPNMRRLVDSVAHMTGQLRSEFIRSALEREIGRSLAHTTMKGSGEVAPHLARIESGGGSARWTRQPEG